MIFLHIKASFREIESKKLILCLKYNLKKLKKE